MPSKSEEWFDGLDQNKPSTLKQKTRKEIRLSLGEAYMFCENCACRLWSFDGDEDDSMKCPYMKNGKCEV